MWEQRIEKIKAKVQNGLKQVPEYAKIAISRLQRIEEYDLIVNIFKLSMEERNFIENFGKFNLAENLTKECIKIQEKINMCIDYMERTNDRIVSDPKFRATKEQYNYWVNKKNNKKESNTVIFNIDIKETGSGIINSETLEKEGSK